MQSTAIGDDLFTGLQVQMKGVGEHHLRAGGLQLRWGDPLHRCQRSHGHEARCGDDAVGGVKAAAARFGARAAGRDLEVEAHRGGRII